MEDVLQGGICSAPEAVHFFAWAARVSDFSLFINKVPCDSQKAQHTVPTQQPVDEKHKFGSCSRAGRRGGEGRKRKGWITVG